MIIIVRIIIHGISKSEAINLLENSVLIIVGIYNTYTSKKSILKTEYTTIILTIHSKQKSWGLKANEKNYEDLMIYFTAYVHSKSIEMLSLYYQELMGVNKEHEGKKYLMVNSYMVDKLLDRIKEIIGIVEFGNTKILLTKTINCQKMLPYRIL